ncbi:hypothetical protein CW749_05780 [Vibrio sp. vnigr-6D03]|uniref:hypothetical protein n=1 Tax=Vibrio sp. vnigr-6D03 TaxID=2058088 RepID=UPI000C33722B|nr:hypothetical protein [Vibrio sp. vnigr-6D03]PKF80431.1 hypothetical protein CW749_05780 [Vibrio sp. vnigr-6D03]
MDRIQQLGNKELLKLLGFDPGPEPYDLVQLKLKIADSLSRDEIIKLYDFTYEHEQVYRHWYVIAAHAYYIANLNEMLGCEWLVEGEWEASPDYDVLCHDSGKFIITTAETLESNNQSLLKSKSWIRLRPILSHNEHVLVIPEIDTRLSTSVPSHVKTIRENEMLNRGNKVAAYENKPDKLLAATKLPWPVRRFSLNAYEYSEYKRHLTIDTIGKNRLTRDKAVISKEMKDSILINMSSYDLYDAFKLYADCTITAHTVMGTPDVTCNYINIHHNGGYCRLKEILDRNKKGDIGTRVRAALLHAHDAMNDGYAGDYNQVAPDVGQGIVTMDAVQQEGAPYHFAGCILRGYNYWVSLESWAKNGASQASINRDWNMFMYQTSGDGSFHGRWSNSFGNQITLLAKKVESADGLKLPKIK